MTSAASSSRDGPADKPPKIGGQMLMMMIMFMMILFLFNQPVRMAIGGALGTVLYPVIGFGGSFPIITLMAAGMMMIVFTTIIRHFFVDWVEMARNQRIVSAFNKELRKARLENNMYKIKKLTEMQKDIMAKSLSSTQTQIKLMPITMLIIIPIFAWIWVFVSESIPSSTFSVPWALDGDLLRHNILPNWILVYSLMTLPFGQVVSRILKFFSFRKRLREMEISKGFSHAGDN